MLACIKCKRLVVSGSKCSVCKSKELTKNWAGICLINDENSLSKISLLSKKDKKGIYAIKVIA